MKNPSGPVDVSQFASIQEAFTVDDGTSEWAGKPTDESGLQIELPTHGAMQLTLADGTVLVIWTSEWGGVSIHPPTNRATQS
jgi:hypothetical protein